MRIAVIVMVAALSACAHQITFHELLFSPSKETKELDHALTLKQSTDAISSQGIVQKDSLFLFACSLVIITFLHGAPNAQALAAKRIDPAVPSRYYGCIVPKGP